ncbi:MAG: sigma 54-interacting transcriptional regulator [Bryobacteraceae bacterium]
MPDDSALKYRALLQISEALIACRDRDALIRSLYETLHPLIAFDYLVIMRYDAARRRVTLKAIAGIGNNDAARHDEWPMEGSAVEIMLETGQPVYVPDMSLETRFRPDLMEIYRANNIQSGYWIALTTARGMHGVLAFSSCTPDAYTAEDREFMQHIGRQVAIATENAVAFEEINELRRHMEDEKVYLEEEIRSEYRFDEMVGSGPALRGVLQQIETAAPTDSSILIQGETGTGKELVARAIHRLSSRANGTFVKLNCAAIPAALIESELLGHEKGAFTGAVGQRIGRFELAHRGTLFLDEIGELPLEMQPKLLRVLQDGQFERLGGNHTIHSDFRLVAATNRDLRTMVAQQQFRADLFYRVNVFPITLPALRERREDIPTLVRYFVQEFATRMRKTIESIPAEVMETLVNYSWPGNIRELRNIIERSVILTTGKRLTIPQDDLRESRRAAPAAVLTMEDAERRHILDALDASNWVVGGPSGAAAMLGMKRSTLQSRMQKLGIMRRYTVTC